MNKIENTKSDQLNLLLKFLSNSSGNILTISRGAVNTSY